MKTFMDLITEFMRGITRSNDDLEARVANLEELVVNLLEKLRAEGDPQ
jgi:hypothetical protein